MTAATNIRPPVPVGEDGRVEGTGDTFRRVPPTVAAPETPRQIAARLPRPLRGALAGMARMVTRELFRALTRTTVIGAEHVPRTGRVILAFNHLGYLDGPLLYAFAPRADVTPVVASTIGDKPIERVAVTLAGGVWIARGASDRAALEAALDVLKQGRVVAIAPEGKISTTGGLLPAQPGTAFLAVRGDAPIVPVAITGTDRALSELRRLRRPRLTLTFGAPIASSDIVPGKAGRLAATDSLMARIAAMLPARRRGEYGDNEPDAPEAES